MSEETGIIPRKIVMPDDDASAMEGIVKISGEVGLEVYNPFATTNRCYTNLDARNPDHQGLIFKCYGEADFKASDIIGKEINLFAVLVRPVETVNEETGEVNVFDRTVLVLDTGTTVAFGSRGIIKMLGVLTGLRGKGPWSPPLKIVVRQIELKDRKRTYTIDLVAERRPTKKGVGNGS